MDAVLPHGMKAMEMSVGTAEHTQGVGDVTNVDQLRMGMDRVKHFLRIGQNPAHSSHLPCFLLLILQTIFPFVNTNLPASIVIWSQKGYPGFGILTAEKEKAVFSWKASAKKNF